MNESTHDAIEARLRELGFRQPRTNADYADESRLHLVKLWGHLDVVAVPLDDQPDPTSTASAT